MPRAYSDDLRWRMMWTFVNACTISSNTLLLFTLSVMQRLPTMLPDTVAVPTVSHVETEFQDHYNTLALEPQDVLTFAQQIASGMVSTDHLRCKWDTASKVSSASSGVLGQLEHPPQRPCLQEHLAVLRQDAEAS